MDANFRSFIIILLVPFLMGFSGDGITASGVGIGEVSPIDLTSCEDLVVAYWNMDETGTNTRVADYGTCADEGSDCDLSATGTVSNDSGIRGQAATVTGLASNYLSCADETCDELDFNNQSFSVLGWTMGTGHLNNFFLVRNNDGTDGYQMYGIDFGDSDNYIFVPESGQVGTCTDCADGFANAWTFSAMSWDESSDEVQGCVGLTNGNWNCLSATSLTGPVQPGTLDFQVGYSSGFDSGITSRYDELAVLNGVITEEWECYICSCWLDGTNCKLSGLDYSERGNNNSNCGDCALPSQADSKTCPTF